jgi:hypothetical protein
MDERKLQEIGSDLAYLRSLAEAGAGGPDLGGRILAAAGVIFGTASFATWILLAAGSHVPPWAHLAIWLTAAALFMGSLALARARVKNLPGAHSHRNKAVGGVWAMVGLAIFILWVAFMVASWRLQAWEMMSLFPSVIFALYGAGWGVAAKVFNVGWIRYVAIGSFAASIATAWLAGQDLQHMISAAGLIAFAAVPGFILLRREPARA